MELMTPTNAYDLLDELGVDLEQEPKTYLRSQVDEGVYIAHRLPDGRVLIGFTICECELYTPEEAAALAATREEYEADAERVDAEYEAALERIAAGETNNV